jgi:hypothetical protein
VLPFIPYPWARTRIATEASIRCCKELSASYTMVVLRMLFNRWYILLTLSTEGASNVSKTVAVVAMFLLALAKVGSCRSTHSTTTVQPASNIDSH